MPNKDVTSSYEMAWLLHMLLILIVCCLFWDNSVLRVEKKQTVNKKEVCNKYIMLHSSQRASGRLPSECQGDRKIIFRNKEEGKDLVGHHDKSEKE